MYEQELPKAEALIAERGKSRDDFAFAMNYQEPDPDGAGMFTVRYDIDIAHKQTGKSLSLVGGIGLDWVAAFDEALGNGYFD